MPEDFILEVLPETVKHNPRKVGHDDSLASKEVSEVIEALSVSIKPA